MVREHLQRTDPLVKLKPELVAISPGMFYFVENGEASFAAITDALALPGPRPWNPDAPDNLWDHQFAIHALGSNSRVRATPSSPAGRGSELTA